MCHNESMGSHTELFEVPEKLYVVYSCEWNTGWYPVFFSHNEADAREHMKLNEDVIRKESKIQVYYNEFIPFSLEDTVEEKMTVWQFLRYKFEEFKKNVI